MAASAPLAALAAGSALAAEPVDPHPAWLAELETLRERDRRGDMTDEEVDVLAGRMTELEELIGETPSGTFAGAVAQVRAAFVMLDDGGSVNLDRDTEALENALATLDALAGRA